MKVSDDRSRILSIPSSIYEKLDQGEFDLLRKLERRTSKSDRGWATAKWFKSNKISGEYLDDKLQWIEAQRLYRLKWLGLFKLVNRLLQDNRIEHVFVKCLDVRYPLVADVDVFIENPIDIVRAVEVLRSQGFVFYEMDRIIKPSLKIAAINPEYAGVNLDIYTEPSWDTFRFQDKWITTKRRRTDYIHGVKAYIPSLEDDLILVSTHALSHGRLTIGEVLHGAEILCKREGKLSWEYIRDRAETWAIHDALYLYLLLVEGYCEVFREKQVIPSDEITWLHDHYRSRTILKWLVKSSQCGFPFLLPLSLLYSIALMRGARLLGKGINPTGDLIRVSLERLSGVRARELELT